MRVANDRVPGALSSGTPAMTAGDQSAVNVALACCTGATIGHPEMVTTRELARSKSLHSPAQVPRSKPTVGPAPPGLQL